MRVRSQPATRRTWRRLGAAPRVALSVPLSVALGVALAVASAIGLVPALAPVPVAAAVPSLSMIGATTYDVLPEEGRIAVTVQLTATNHLKDTVTQRFFYSTGYVTVVPGVSNLKLTGDSPKAKVSISSRTDTYTNLKIEFGANLAAGKSTTLRLTFDLRDEGGRPDRAVHVSHSVVSFAAWAVATPSTPGATVDVRFPEGYSVAVSRGPLDGPVSDATGHEIWTSGILQAPLEFVADLSADRPTEFAETSLTVPMAAGPATVLVRAWPDDTAWRDRVLSLVKRALPVLERAIGVPWPVQGQLAVHEALIRTTGGYAGVFDPSVGTIEIAYSAPDGVVLHELAHAWFNGTVVGDRWAAEAFAAYYAELAAKELGVDPGVPALPTEPSAAAIPLNAWGPPGSEDAATETWAYAASLELARQVAVRAGPAVLHAVWSKAARGIDAYQPDPPVDEPAGGAPDWRGLLDLLEAESGEDFTDLWRQWVARPDDLAVLDDRAVVRGDYLRSAELAGEWRLPAAPRLAMRAWQFDVARELLLATDAVLRQRDTLEAAAAAAGARLPETLRRTFEGEGGLAAAAAEAEAEQTVVDAIIAAEAARPAETGIVDRVIVGVGLLSTNPEVRLGEALTALTAGDLEASYEAATDRALGVVIGRARGPVAYRERGAAAPGAPVPRGYRPAAKAGPGVRGELSQARSGGRRSMGRAAGASGRRIGGVLLATLFAIGLALSPTTAGTVAAATEPLRTKAEATYTLDPESGRVHVEIDVTETDLKPNSATFVYYYVSFGFALQPEATSISVSGGSADRITTKKRDGYIAATVHISKALYYKQSTSFTIRYDLVGGKPRSTTPTRVGAAYSTFGVWAWGDPGHSIVEVRTPAGFDTHFVGDTMQITTSATTGQILRATPADPFKFYTIITAEDGDAYTETRLSLEGGVEIVVQSWPEDGKWRTAVTGTLRDTMPELRGLIGLDWPVAHDLDVRERFTPDLEGYAGFFLTDEQRIEVSEDLDPVVIVHEASHAWFNDALFVERWIYEGLAEEYAWRALVGVGEDDGGGATLPKLDDPGFADLERWTHPGVIRDQETDDTERYGYEASFWVVHQIVEAAGVDRMREAFALADQSVTAYPGAGPLETISNSDGWRRLLDLTEPVDQPEPAAVDKAFRDFVLGSAGEAELDERQAARDEYRTLLERGSGWLAPWYVRKPMGDWAFDEAMLRMGDAQAFISLRDRVSAASLALDLVPDGALKTTYEGATDSFDDATALANRQLASLAAIDDARAKVSATPDLVSQIGLLGETPQVSYEGARSAFQAGNLEGATALAATASSIVSGAAVVGQQRLVIAVVSTVVALLLLVLLVLLVRRRSRRRRALILATAQATLATDPAPTEPYATLAAHPATEHDEGGPGRGDSPADP